jgi:hypothetical protein
MPKLAASVALDSRLSFTFGFTDTSSSCVETELEFITHGSPMCIEPFFELCCAGLRCCAMPAGWMIFG